MGWLSEVVDAGFELVGFLDAREVPVNGLVLPVAGSVAEVLRTGEGFAPFVFLLLGVDPAVGFGVALLPGGRPGLRLGGIILDPCPSSARVSCWPSLMLAGILSLEGGSGASGPNLWESALLSSELAAVESSPPSLWVAGSLSFEPSLPYSCVPILCETESLLVAVKFEDVWRPPNIGSLTFR